MEKEKVLSIIEKLVAAGIVMDELKEVSMLINDDDFIETYAIIGNIDIALTPTGRDNLKKEIALISGEYQSEARVISIRRAGYVSLYAISACFLIAFSTFVFHAVMSYNNPKNFTTFHIEKTN